MFTPDTSFPRADCISGTLLCILILLVSFSALALREAIVLGDLDLPGFDLGGGADAVDPLEGWEQALNMHAALPNHLVPVALRPPQLEAEPAAPVVLERDF